MNLTYRCKHIELDKGLFVLEKGRENVEIACQCAIFLEKDKQHEHIIFGSIFFEHFKILFDYPHNRFSIKQ